jgi:hypothetical protein
MLVAQLDLVLVLRSVNGLVAMLVTALVEVLEVE